MTSSRVRRAISISVAILALLLALAPLALAGTEEGGGDGEDGGGSPPPVSLPADLTGTNGSLGATPPQQVSDPQGAGTAAADDGEGASSEDSASPDDSGSEEGDDGDDADGVDSDGDSPILGGGGLVRPVALLGLAAAGLIVLRRL